MIGKLKMKKNILIIVIFLLMLNGCSVTQLRYGQAVSNGTVDKYIESLGGKAAFQTMSSLDMQFLCAAYANDGDFETSIECIDAHLNRFYNSKNDSDIQATVSMLTMRSLMSFTIGDYEDVVTFSDKGIAFMDRHNLNDDAFLIGDQIKGSRLRLLQKKLIASHKLERVEQEEKTFQVLQGFIPWIKKQPRHADLAGITTRDQLYAGLANSYYQVKRYEAAADLFRNNKDSSEDKARDVLGGIASFGVGFFKDAMAEKRRKKTSQGPYYIGKAYSEVKQYKEAIKEFEVIQSNHIFDRHSGYLWRFLHDFAQAYIGVGNHKKAIPLLEQSISIIESQRSNLRNEKNKIGFVGNRQAVYSDLVSALMDTSRYVEAFSYAERGKARALVDMLASKKRFSGGNVMSASAQKQLLAQLDAAKAKTNVLGNSRTDKSAIRGIANQNLSALIQQAPELSSLVTVTAPDIKEIQSLLPDEETLIEYYGSENKLFAFVVTKDGIKGIKLNIVGLNDSVTKFRKAILDPKSNAYKKHAARLYKQIIAPVFEGISSKNITIVPHGALHYVPFLALSSNKGFLIDQYNLRILPSASVMKFLKKNQNKAGSLLAFGNPDLGDAKYDLPGAQKEAEMITSRTSGAKLLVRKKATETAVKRYGNSFKYLHFASHGTFDAENPLSSGLLLTKDDQNDGILTVGELYDLNLNADLVTLSACETALGKVANGDDVVGFTRGFLYAGASSIVSSLWQIDDAATSILMQDFYDNLSKTDKRSALRNAQLSLKAKYNHPYYWAAFQITGAVN